VSTLINEREVSTILVVDDDPMVLAVVVLILQRSNFNVLFACDGADAVELAEATDEKIDLLISDIDMPLMSGPALGEALKQARPDMRVMFMSGGTNGNLLVLNYGWAFIEKPFVAAKLVQMVSNVLHSPDRSQPGGHEFDAPKV